MESGIDLVLPNPDFEFDWDKIYRYASATEKPDVAAVLSSASFSTSNINNPGNNTLPQIKYVVVEKDGQLSPHQDSVCSKVPESDTEVMENCDTHQSKGELDKKKPIPQKVHSFDQGNSDYCEGKQSDPGTILGKRGPNVTVEYVKKKSWEESDSSKECNLSDHVGNELDKSEKDGSSENSQSQKDYAHRRDSETHQDSAHSKGFETHRDSAHIKDYKSHRDSAHRKHSKSHRDSAHSKDSHRDRDHRKHSTSHRDSAHSKDSKSQRERAHRKHSTSHRDSAHRKDSRSHAGSAHSNDSKSHRDRAHSSDSESQKDTAHSKDSKLHSHRNSAHSIDSDLDSAHSIDSKSHRNSAHHKDPVSEKDSDHGKDLKSEKESANSKDSRSQMDSELIDDESSDKDSYLLDKKSDSSSSQTDVQKDKSKLNDNQILFHKFKLPLPVGKPSKSPMKSSGPIGLTEAEINLDRISREKTSEFGTTCTSDDSDYDDFEDVSEVGSMISKTGSTFIREHGFGTWRYNLNIDVTPEITEDDNNTDIIQNLVDAQRLIDTKFGPMVSRWLEVSEYVHMLAFIEHCKFWTFSIMVHLNYCILCQMARLL
jgi:hypothetical protein